MVVHYRLQLQKLYVAGQSHVFTTGDVGSDTNVTFRVRSKDNEGGFSADRIISFTVADIPPPPAFGGIGGGTISGYISGGHYLGGSRTTIDKFAFSSNVIATDVGDLIGLNIIVLLFFFS